MWERSRWTLLLSLAKFESENNLVRCQPFNFFKYEYGIDWQSAVYDQADAHLPPLQE